MKIFAKDFLGKLSATVLKAQKDIPVFQPEEVSSRDEAIEHAKAYWMLGWTWDEIELVLSDMDFSQADTNAALEVAQEYAITTLKEGPFAIFKEGQFIKLKNGLVGKFASASPDAMLVETKEDTFQVTAKDIDVHNSLKLKEAFTLRETASKILAELPERLPRLFDKKPEEKMIQESPSRKKELVGPSPVRERMSVEPDKDKFVMYPGRTKSPSGWEGLTPKLTETADLPKLAEDAVAQIDALDLELEKVKKDNAEINKMAKEIREKKTTLEQQQREEAQKIFAIIAAQNAEVKELNKTVFHKYKNKVIGLQNLMISSQTVPSVEEELNAVREFLSTNHPKIMEELEGILSDWTQQNTLIKEHLETTFAYYKPSEVSQKRKSQLMEKIVDWANKTWAKVKKTIRELTNKIYPEINEGISAIDDLTIAVENSRVTAKVNKAVMAKLHKGE